MQPPPGLSQRNVHRDDHGYTALAHLDDECVFDKAIEKDQFSNKYLRCITNPDRALETLGPHAELELLVGGAQNLPPRDTWANAVTLLPCDSAVGVFLDDIKLEGAEMQTKVIRGTSSPLWQHRMTIPVVSPWSMVRLQVYDDQITRTLETGFVEFSLADVPYDTPIEGWLELRFQENLRANSVKRYASHSLVREDELGITPEAEVNSHVSTRQVKTNVSSAVSLQDLKSRRSVGTRALLKTRTLFQGCGNACMGSSGNSQAMHEDDRGNAGELYVSIRLKRTVGIAARLCALALEMPSPAEHGEYVLHEDAPAKTRVDLQACVDKVQDMRSKLFEDFVCCLYYYARYIATWRNPLVSIPWALCGLLAVNHAYYATITLPMLLSFSLLLNSIPGLRQSMTRGGWNAALNEEGFGHAARWTKTPEMMKFLTRIVEKDLGGSVDDEAKLRLLAQKCFRDGVPVVPYKLLVQKLLKSKDIISVDIGSQTKFSRGDKVIVDERYRAEIHGSAGNGAMHVVYEACDPDDLDDTPPAGGGAPIAVNMPSSVGAPAGPTDPPAVESVEIARIRHRTVVSSMGSWLLPTSLSNLLSDLMRQISKIEHSAVYPTIQTMTEVVTWKRKSVACSLFLLLAGLSAVFAVTEKLYEHDQTEARGDQHGELLESAAWVFIAILRNVDNTVIFLIVLCCFFLNARWLVTARSIVKIFGRLPMELGRSAPRHWSFFRQDHNMKGLVSNLSATK